VYVTPPESELRLPIREKVVGFVGQSLARDNWTGTIATSETSGILSAGADEGWLEDRIVIDVTARTKQDEPLLIPVSDFSPTLTAVRKKLVTFVELQGGVAVDWWTVEAHGERTLVFLYRHGEINGTVRVRVRHRAEDRPEEMVTRFEVTMRER
jgi:hypothetical protein